MKTLLLGGALWLPSLPVLARFLSLPVVAAHALVTLLGAAWFLSGRSKPSLRLDRGLSLLLFAVLTAVFLVVYPLSNSGTFGGGSDRDDAIERGAAALLDGRYPYYERTSLDQEISPLPGALVLAIPFVLLDAVPAQSLAWLGAWVLVLATRRSSSLTIALLTLGSPAVVHDIVTGGDLTANSLYVLAAMLAVSEAPDGLRWPSYLFAGLALSSRPTFWLVLLPLAFHLRKTGRRPETAIPIIVLTCAAVTLPFYLWDPAAFSPLHVADKLAGARALLPLGDWVLAAASAGAVLALGSTVDGKSATWLYVSSFSLLLPPVLASGAMWLIGDYRWPEFLYFGLPAALFAVPGARSGTAS